MPATAILLIPGFFGYSAFGPDSHPILEYFGGVRAVLQPLHPDHFIVTHEPPPTGTLASRVKSLYEAVGKLLRGELLPHGRRPFKADRIHLVGHSTGGVDARLFANPAYTWDTALPRADRENPLSALGNIVTVSAPFRGTPLAVHISADNALLLEGIRILAMLGVFADGDLVRIGLELAKFSPGALLSHPLAIPGAIATALDPRKFVTSLTTLFASSDGGIYERSESLLAAIAAIGQPPSISKLVAAQVSAFFRSIEAHHELLCDLTVDSMAQRTKSLTQTDHGRKAGDSGAIHSYVTVAPEPQAVPLLDVDALVHFEVVQAFIYATLYKAAKEPPVVPGVVPSGPLVDGNAALDLVGGASASDGVIPTRSQTIDGTAAGIVLGDHLDVVGSFDGGSGANVMRSGARFGGDRFVKLWTDIAGRLA